MRAMTCHSASSLRINVTTYMKVLDMEIKPWIKGWSILPSCGWLRIFKIMSVLNQVSHRAPDLNSLNIIKIIVYNSKDSLKAASRT